MTQTDPDAAGVTEHHSPTRSRAMLIAAILLSVTLAAVAQIMLKNGMDRVVTTSGEAFTPTSVGSLKAAATTPLVWLGLLTFGLSALVWLAVLSRTELSFAYPFASLTYVIILLYGRFIGDEPVSAVRWAGVGFIVVGIVLIAQDATTTTTSAGGG